MKDIETLLQYLERCTNDRCLDQGARQWTRAAIHHLAQRDSRHLAAAATCLLEAARYTRNAAMRSWLRSIANHLQAAAWNSMN